MEEMNQGEITRDAIRDDQTRLILEILEKVTTVEELQEAKKQIRGLLSR